MYMQVIKSTETIGDKILKFLCGLGIHVLYWHSGWIYPDGTKPTYHAQCFCGKGTKVWKWKLWKPPKWRVGYLQKYKVKT